MTSQSKSQREISRRDLMRVAAAGAAAASIAAPASAQTTAVVGEASPADYARDRAGWGSAAVAALFPGFKHVDMRTKGATIRVRHGGSGPPLLLLHGYPNSHVLWHAVAAKLAQNYHVVCPDLRGYGDSSLPEPGEKLINYSHRVMAEDMIEVMEQLGHQRFFLIGRDHQLRHGRGRQRQADHDAPPRPLGDKRHDADKRISDGVAQICAQSRGHRAASHRALHTRGNARAVPRPFRQILHGVRMM